MAVDPTPLVELQSTVPRHELDRYSADDEVAMSENAEIGDELADEFDL